MKKISFLSLLALICMSACTSFSRGDVIFYNNSVFVQKSEEAEKEKKAKIGILQAAQE